MDKGLSTTMLKSSLLFMTISLHKKLASQVAVGDTVGTGVGASLGEVEGVALGAVGEGVDLGGIVWKQAGTGKRRHALVRYVHVVANTSA
mmetsp:Transcript_32435/g.49608  ORF Transcript_32435/g.49608 Transcript_32435/m.49608 type:complete len:90 (+) Transcript_32435:525-794(+)